MPQTVLNPIYFGLAGGVPRPTPRMPRGRLPFVYGADYPSLTEPEIRTVVTPVPVGPRAVPRAGAPAPVSPPPVAPAVPTRPPQLDAARLAATREDLARLSVPALRRVALESSVPQVRTMALQLASERLARQSPAPYLPSLAAARRTYSSQMMPRVRSAVADLKATVDQLNARTAQQSAARDRLSDMYQRRHEALMKRAGLMVPRLQGEGWKYREPGEPAYSTQELFDYLVSRPLDSTTKLRAIERSPALRAEMERRLTERMAAKRQTAQAAAEAERQRQLAALRERKARIAPPRAVAQEELPLPKYDPEERVRYLAARRAELEARRRRVVEAAQQRAAARRARLGVGPTRVTPGQMMAMMGHPDAARVIAAEIEQQGRREALGLQREALGLERERFSAGTELAYRQLEQQAEQKAKEYALERDRLMQEGRLEEAKIAENRRQAADQLALEMRKLDVDRQLREGELDVQRRRVEGEIEHQTGLRGIESQKLELEKQKVAQAMSPQGVALGVLQATGDVGQAAQGLEMLQDIDAQKAGGGVPTGRTTDLLGGMGFSTRTALNQSIGKQDWQGAASILRQEIETRIANMKARGLIDPKDERNWRKYFEAQAEEYLQRINPEPDVTLDYPAGAAWYNIGSYWPDKMRKLRRWTPPSVGPGGRLIPPRLRK